MAKTRFETKKSDLNKYPAKNRLSVEIILSQPCKRSDNEAQTLPTMTNEQTFAVAQIIK